MTQPTINRETFGYLLDRAYATPNFDPQKIDDAANGLRREVESQEAENEGRECVLAHDGPPDYSFVWFLVGLALLAAWFAAVTIARGNLGPYVGEL